MSISYCLFHHESWLLSPHTVPSSPWRRTGLVVTPPHCAPDPWAWWERAGILHRVSLQLGGVLTHGAVPHHVSRAPVLTQPTL